MGQKEGMGSVSTGVGSGGGVSERGVWGSLGCLRKRGSYRREKHGLQARERLVSISMRASWLFLWKMSFHRIVSWWQSCGFR